jgi:uncharacterized surface protein with fasciclin (FAS1) repeats
MTLITLVSALAAIIMSPIVPIQTSPAMTNPVAVDQEAIRQGMRSQNPMVGGMMMSAQKDIVDNAVNPADHTTLVAAIKAAGLVDTLKSMGPFTVFAPTNAAFAMLPAGTVDSLLMAENKDKLSKILTYHVVAGKFDYDTLARLIRTGKGSTTLMSVGGGRLVAMMNGAHNMVIKDEHDDIASISTYDVRQSNGIIHVITKVLLPR